MSRHFPLTPISVSHSHFPENRLIRSRFPGMSLEIYALSRLPASDLAKEMWTRRISGQLVGRFQLSSPAVQPALLISMMVLRVVNCPAAGGHHASAMSPSCGREAP